MPDDNNTPNEHFLQPTDLDKQIIVNPLGGAAAQQPTMSSLEIADLLGCRHDNVRRTIERLADKGVVTLPPMEEKPTAGRPTLVYTLSGEQGKRDSYIIVAQLSPEFTAKLVDRWQELEAARAAAAPLIALNDPGTLRALLLDNVEERLRLANEMAAAVPKLAAFDRIANSEGSLCITDAAKSLQVRPKALFDFLRSQGWIYAPPGGRGDIAYSAKLQQGLMEHKTTTVHRSDGSEKIITQARVTPKGLARLATEFPPPVARAA